MTDEQKKNDGRMLVIPDPLWSQLIQHAFNETQRTGTRVPYSEIARRALTDYFEKLEGDRS